MQSLTSELAERIGRVFVEQRLHCDVLKLSTARERIARLKRLQAAVVAHRREILEALQLDFRKAQPESDLTEVVPTLLEIKHTIHHVRRWMKPQRVRTPLLFLGTKSRVRYDSKGVVLIIAPWNYTVLLTLGPLASAIAAGNCVIIKPSESTPHTSAVLRRMLCEIFPENEVCVFEGDAGVAQELLAQPFDHIFFTGSPPVGKEVMRAAATHLCSVTLELGGKSPAIVDVSADIKSTAAKLAVGAFINAGQTCIAPDYVLVHESRHDELVEALSKEIRRLYGPETGPDRPSTTFAHVIDERHFDRLRGLVDDALRHGAKVAYGGGSRREDDCYLEPTVLTHVPIGCALMHEEIFGPVLPILTFRTVSEAVATVRGHSNPLTIYVFTRDRSTTEEVLLKTWAGGTLVNDTLIHYAQPNLPFGGVNYSGIGRAHGHAGFLAFSSERAVMVQRMRHPFFRLIYPPYTPTKERLINLVIRYLRL